MSVRAGIPSDVNPADRESLLAPSTRTKVGRLTLRQLSVIQWVGTLVAPLVWAGQHVVGYGIGQAECRAGGRPWGIDNDVWQLTLVSVAGLLVVIGWVAALVVFLHTKGADWGDGPPEEGRWKGQSPYGRLYFFSCAALVANVFFLAIMLLDAMGSVFDTLCRQS